MGLATLGALPGAHAERATPAHELAATPDAPAGETIRLTTAQGTPAAETPLLAFALEQEPPVISLVDYSAMRLKEITAAMERNPPPPKEECAQTLGARRFAGLYENLASLRVSQGDFDAALEAHEAALACTPRNPFVHAHLASLYISMGRLAEARAAIERGRAVDPDELQLLVVLARIDFLEERWADATSRFRLIAVLEQDEQRAAFYQCFLFLAQRRAGVQHPELVTRELREGWPAPLLDMLKGELTEAQLVEQMREMELPRRPLTEALYYVGELRLAQGDADAARRHFAAAVNLKVMDFIEHGMAVAELAKMRVDPAAARPGDRSLSE